MAVIPTQQDYDRDIRGYIKAATGLGFVVPGNANSPAPTVPYASVLLIADTRDGFSSINKKYNEINENYDYVINDNHEMVYSVQIYRSPNAMGLARGLTSFHQTPNGQFELLSRGLVIINSDDATNTDLVTDGDFEPRSTLNMTFGLVSRVDQVVETLLETTIDECIEVEDGTVFQESIIINLNEDVFPVLGIVGSSTLDYTEGDPPTIIVNEFSLSDIDNNSMQSATIRISNNYSISEDILGFNNTANISSNFDIIAGILTLNGNDTIEAYKTALANVTYENTSTTPSILQRTVEFFVNDGQYDSNIVAEFIDITAT